MSRREEIFKNFIKYKDETEDRVKNDIEKNRKCFAKVTLKDKDGNPIIGKKIKINQKKHEFLHGANIFMLDELETEEKNNKYKEFFKDAFNEATLPFYWNDLEPEEGKPRFAKNSPKIYRRPAPDLCLEYCEKYGITPKAHCLTYFNFQPDWVDKTDIGDMKRKLEKRYKALAERYSSRINGWEVINELFCIDPWYKNPFFRSEDVLDWNFKLAEKYFPCNELIINEASQVWKWGHFAYTRSGYFQMIKQGLEKGLRIDAVGMQYHMFYPPEYEKGNVTDMYNPLALFSVLDTYEKLGKPLQITEITIPAYTDSAEDEKIQAELIEQLYSIWFSHKAVEAIIYWNLTDGYAAWAPQGDMTAGENVYRGGLLRFDMSKKPAYDMIYHLFNERWITKTEAETDGSGIAKFKGFYGDYELTVDDKKLDISLKSNSENEIEIQL